MCRLVTRTSRYVVFLLSCYEKLFSTVHFAWIADYQQLLQQLHDKLTRKLSPASAIDPFTVLPAELAEMVLEYCSFRHMVNCMRVSKGWRDYLSKLPKLWMHLDLSGARRPVPRSFVNTAFKRSEYRMTRVTIHRFEHMDVLKNLAKAAKDLSELELISLPHTMSATLIDIVKSAPKLRKFTVHPEITQDTAEQIMHARPVLEHVVFGALRTSRTVTNWTASFENLRTLSIHWSSPIPAGNFMLTDLLGRMPCLESLSLSNVQDLEAQQGWPRDEAQLPPLKSLALKRVNIEQFPLLPPMLQRLVIENDGGRLNLANIAALHRCCVPELTHLAISGFKGLNVDTLGNLLDTCSHNSETRACMTPKPLQSLTLHGLLYNQASDLLFRSEKMESILGTSPRVLTPALEAMDISTMPCGDDEIERLLTYETGLKTIDLSHTNITGASIKMLADKLPKLTSIKANNCTRINGRDAINYAERKGIAVSCQMLEQKGGRRIRYG
jgi:F-box/TPR repeat protein Pof3